ncbi:MAG TPA: TonB family protein [Marinilabiliaceae bacterium]|nr:TonB family protein [Marinilabiliaceae bacterium]
MKSIVIFLASIKSSLIRCPLYRSLLFLILLVATLPLTAQSTTTDSIFENVDKLAKFKGKPSKLDKFVSKQLIYPDDAWREGIEGVVLIQGIVTKEGQLMELSVKESVDPLLDMEALRVVELMQNWEPAQKNKLAVHSRIVVPVSFSLSPDERDFVSTLQKFGLDKNPPLYILDDKILHTRVQIPSYNVKSIRVLKGEKAIEKYGDKAQNGVVIITSKRGTPPVR